MDRLQLHPRVAQQGITLETAQKILESSLPKLAPFDGRAVSGGLAVLDWDHRLPSRALTLRLHLCYQPEQLDHLSKAFAARTEEIARGERYPDFDVPDYAGLPSDEAYDGE